MGDVHDLKKYIPLKTHPGDSLVRGLCLDKQIQCSSVVLTESVAEVCKSHGYDPLQSILLGRALVAACLLGSNAKVAGESLQLSLNGDGPLKQVVAEYIYPGNLRGFCSSLVLEQPIQTFGDAIGEGTLSVKRVLHGNAEPYVGVSKLVSGEVGEDVAQYLLESEQVPSTISVGVKIDKDSGRVLAAGGVLLQKIAGTEIEASVIDALHEKVTGKGGILGQIESGESSLQIFKSISHVSGDADEEEVSETPIKANCPCARERFKKAMQTISYSDLLEAHRAHGRLEAVCQYCGKAYQFELAEFQS